MRAPCRLRDPDGTEWVLGVGDVLGRLVTAALPFDDGRVSEAHAMVSMRGGELKLISLRGLLATAGAPQREVTLAVGLRAELAPGVAVDVLQVTLPEAALALRGDGLSQQLLMGACSLVLRPQPVLLARHRDDDAAHLWTSGDGWRLRLRGAAPRDLAAGDQFRIDDVAFEAVGVPLRESGSAATKRAGAWPRSLRICTYFDQVHVYRQDEGGDLGDPPCVIDGIGARILSELVAFRDPVDWQTVAGEVWRDTADRALLRHRWDVALGRLRARLRHAGIRADLIHIGGQGVVSCLLYDGDIVDDRS